MTKKREAIFGSRKPAPNRTFVPALRVGDVLYLSGTTGTDENGKITAPDDVEEQTRQIFRKFSDLLTSIGGSCDDIVSTTDYFLTLENYSKTANVRREVFKKGFPTATGVQVAGLIRKDALIEISAIAVLPADRN